MKKKRMRKKRKMEMMMTEKSCLRLCTLYNCPELGWLEEWKCGYMIEIVLSNFTQSCYFSVCL